jgi:hypothetical protein
MVKIIKISRCAHAHMGNRERRGMIIIIWLVSEILETDTGHR